MRTCDRSIISGWCPRLNVRLNNAVSTIYFYWWAYDRNVRRLTHSSSIQRVQSRTRGPWTISRRSKLKSAQRPFESLENGDAAARYYGYDTAWSYVRSDINYVYLPTCLLTYLPPRPWRALVNVSLNSTIEADSYHKAYNVPALFTSDLEWMNEWTKELLVY